MEIQPPIEARRTAILTIDYQNEWTDQIAKGDLLDKVAKVQDAARKASIPVIHIRTALTAIPGVPDSRYQKELKARGWGKEGSKGTQINAKVGPKVGEIVITKQHEGPFIGTDLEHILHAMDRYHLVVMGIPTSRAVRNIATDGCNRHFIVTILADCCADAKPEVHTALTEKVLRHQANTPVSSAEFLVALAGSPATSKKG